MRTSTYRLIVITISVLFGLILFSCSRRLTPEPLQVSTRQSLALLQEHPQFIMYMNFKNMRNTEYWRSFINDSLIKAESSFGTLLNTFARITKTTISTNLDEIYFTNSWYEENAIVLKGAFDKYKIYNYLNTDTLFSKINRNDGIELYIYKPSQMFFFFKDNFTLCASSSLSQIDKMVAVTDTSRSGLLLNNELMQYISQILYKEHFWLITAEKTFVRAIFLNFVQSNKTPAGRDTTTFLDSAVMKDKSKLDSLNQLENIAINKLHQKVTYVSFSGKMKSDLRVIVQFGCNNEDDVDYVYKFFSGVISAIKIGASFNKNDKNQELLEMLEQLDLQVQGSTLYINFVVTKDNIAQIRKLKPLTPIN